MGDRHFSRVVRCGLNEHRYSEVSQAQGVGDGAFFTEIGQSHYDPIDAIAMLSEEIGAAPRLFPCFHRAVLTLLWSQRHNVNVSRFQYTDHLLPSALGQVVREKASIAYDEAHRHFLVSHRMPPNRNTCFQLFRAERTKLQIGTPQPLAQPSSLALGVGKCSNRLPAKALRYSQAAGIATLVEMGFGPFPHTPGWASRRDNWNREKIRKASRSRSACG